MMGTPPPSVAGQLRRALGSKFAGKIDYNQQDANYMLIRALRAMKKGKKMTLPKDQVSLGRMVGRAIVLSRKIQVIELRRGDNLDDWRDPEKVYGRLSSGPDAGLAGNLLKQARFGGRLARDLYDYSSGADRGQPSASVANFKITPSSPNTARVTVGPDRRTRRKKYEWERVDTQRKIQKAVVTAAIVGGAAAGAKLYQKGGGSIARGAVTVAKEAAQKVGDISRGAVSAMQGKAFVPRAQNRADTQQAVMRAIAKKKAEDAAKKGSSKITPITG